MKQFILTFFLIALLFSTSEVKSQDQDNTKTPYIPNLTVAPPQVASLSKVGEIPIDISTGRMNYTIPIFEIKEGNFTMPINLSYNYSGLVLDETPGYAGVGWTFNIGGSILHSINGLNDEGHENDKKYIHSYVNKLPPYHDEITPAGKTTISHFLEGIANGIYDGEPDKYIINAGTINCSFYLDKDNNAIFLKNENYKISGYSHSGFILTDDQGIKYIFNAPQRANKVTPQEQSSYTSSFLLTEINFPHTTNTIVFEYDTAANSYMDTNITQTLIETTNQLGNNKTYSLNTNNTDTQLGFIKLKKIITNNYTIELQYSNNPKEPAIGVISNLSVKDKFSKAVKSYDFNYSDWTGRRTNLLNVKFNGQLLNEMEYDMSLPYPTMESDRDYAKKDLWGYYNKKGSPAIANGIITPYDNPGIKPDFANTKIGSLKKITYQTKGYSLIEYEPNTVFMRSKDYNFPYDSDGTTITSVSASTSALDGMPDETTFEITKIPAQLTLNYLVNNYPDVDPYGDQRDTKVLLFKNGIGELNPDFVFKQTWLRELTWIPQKTSFSGSSNKTITTPGLYHIKAYSTIGSGALLNIKFKQTDEFFNQTVGGIRVKRVQNCDFNGECMTTVYNYSEDGKSTGVMLQKPEFYSGYSIYDNIGCNRGYLKQQFYNYTSIYPLSNYRGSPVLYKKVEKTDFGKGKDNQLISNGKTMFTYYGSEVTNSLQDEESYFTIGLLATKSTKEEGNSLVNKQINSYIFQERPDVPKYVYALNCKIVMERRVQFGGGCSLSYPRPSTDFRIDKFMHETKNYAIKKVENRSFYHGDSLVQTTVYDYNLNTGFLKSQITKNSNNETLETKYFYPVDDEMTSEPFRNELVTKNRIQTPLVIQNYNNIKLSEQKTVYDKNASTSDLLVPKNVYTNKGAAAINLNSDKKITYDLYDDKGNILQYTQEGSTPVSIIWGYNKTQPIAKIENVTYASIPSATITSLQALSDADDDNCMSDSCKEQQLRNALNALRNTLAQSMITSYTYNPLIGVTSITDAKGISSYYEYDPFNRLKFVKDKDLNVVQKYCYNYKGQQVNCSDNSSTSDVQYKSIARNGSFTKNDCTSGGVASSIPFNQVMGAVISTISQEDADTNGLALFNANGQSNANANGICTYSSIARSGPFTKNDCTVGGVTSTLNYNQLVGAVTSTISQADADSKGLIKFNIDGQAYANANSTCTYNSIARSGSFTRNNCTVGGVGSVINYSQEAAAVTSTISQIDADAKALDLFNTNGQANANTNGICTYSSIARNGSFTKNDCAAGGVSSAITHSQLAGAVTSTISQVDADSIGLEKFNTEGQIYANANAICTFNNTAKTVWLIKNNCTIGGTPSGVWYTVPAGKYSSNDSQADADNKAQLDINTSGQDYANSTAECTFQSIAYSRSFQKDNCEAGAVGSYHDYSQPQGTITLNTSQADVDTLAWTKFYNEGQANANTYGNCTFYNVAKSATANKNNCEGGKYGSSVTYTVPARKYSSNSSQLDVDNRAQLDVNNNYQSYINANGTCTSETYNVYLVDAESNKSKIWVRVTSSSASHPDRDVHVTFYYSYKVGQKINNGYRSKTLILPAGVTNQTFEISLSFISAELDSYTIN